MLTRHPAFAGFLVVLVMSLGCSSRPMEEDWGTAYDLTKEAQVLDPDAGQSADPVTGLDGMASSSEMKKYRKSFEKEERVGAQQQRRGVFIGASGASSGT